MLWFHRDKLVSRGDAALGNILLNFFAALCEILGFSEISPLAAVWKVGSLIFNDQNAQTIPKKAWVILLSKLVLVSYLTP